MVHRALVFLVALTTAGCASSPDSDTIFFKGEIVGYRYIRGMDASDFPDEKPEPGMETIYPNSWFNVRFLITDRLGGHVGGQHIDLVLGWHSPPILDRAHRRYLERFVFAGKQSDGSYVGWWAYAHDGFCVSQTIAEHYGFAREWHIANDRYPCHEKSTD